MWSQGEQLMSEPVMVLLLVNSMIPLGTKMYCVPLFSSVCTNTPFRTYTFVIMHVYCACPRVTLISCNILLDDEQGKL